MKESGINKLIELLNEYCKEKKIGRWSMLENGCLFHGNKPINNKKEEFDLLVISKHYGFIQWLVDNDKIDRDEINNNHLDIEIFYKQTYGPNYGEGGYGEIDYWYKCIGLYESLLCNLAISKNPISDLISYLK